MFTTLIFTIMFQLQRISVDKIAFTATQPGEYYEMTDLKYDPQLGQTLALWVRYAIDYTGETKAHVDHVQIRHVLGIKTKEEMTQEALPVIGSIQVVDNPSVK